ncbi:MAG: hypothetical protein ACRECD_09830 [Burkholderiaceae bacterium]
MQHSLQGAAVQVGLLHQLGQADHAQALQRPTDQRCRVRDFHAAVPGTL